MLGVYSPWRARCKKIGDFFLMTVLGIDYGEKRIGIAVSDEEENFAFGLEIISYKKIDEAILRINEIVKEKEIRLVVVGFPINMNGSIGQKAEEVDEFCTILKDKISPELTGIVLYINTSTPLIIACILAPQIAI